MWCLGLCPAEAVKCIAFAYHCGLPICFSKLQHFCWWKLLFAFGKINRSEQMEHHKSKLMQLSNLSLLTELLCTISHVSAQGFSLVLIHKQNTHGSQSALEEWHMNTRETKIKIFSRSSLAGVREVLSRKFIICVSFFPVYWLTF